MSSSARKLAGEAYALMRTINRSAAQEMRLSELHTAFGDHAEAATCLVKAANKGSREAQRELQQMGHRYP